MAHVVAAAMLDGGHPFEFSVACEVFGLERPEVPGFGYELWLCTGAGGVTLQGGAQLSGTHDLADLARADTVVIPHGVAGGDPDAELVALLRRAHERGARLVSFCTGAFVLAAAGLLDGRRATTHWMYAEAFRRRFPRVALDENVLFVDEGQVLTSAGTAAAIDLGLHIVRRDLGADAAQTVARRMVVAPHREGGQAQFIAPAHRPRVASDELAELLDWAAAHLEQDLTVAELASRAAMSQRTFLRRFKEGTGTTPSRWLLAQRLQRARALLETTDWGIEAIAGHCGLGTAANLRDHFSRELTTTPSAYRRAFQRRPQPA